MKGIFTEGAVENIRTTGNVWGATNEYVFNKTYIFLGRKFRFQQKRKGCLMGRVGGGWDIEFGVQIGGSSIIVNLFVMSIRIDRHRRAS